MISPFQHTSAPTPTPPFERRYEYLHRQALTGQATYAFLERSGRQWAVLTYSARKHVTYDPSDTFGMSVPTLRWVNGDQIVEVFVDGMDTATFLAQSGLELSLHKGGFVLSKRLSRLIRPQALTGFFPAETVRVRYLPLDEIGAKVWDGAAVISREMVLRLTAQLPELSAAKRERLLREAQHTTRVEFTLLTERGQEKGHAIVSDTLEVDFLLPGDIKREVKLTDGNTFVAVQPVHGQTDMRLDIQSLINLYPFFEPTQLSA